MTTTKLASLAVTVSRHVTVLSSKDGPVVHKALHFKLVVCPGSHWIHQASKGSNPLTRNDFSWREKYFTTLYNSRKYCKNLLVGNWITLEEALLFHKTLEAAAVYGSELTNLSE